MEDLPPGNPALHGPSAKGVSQVWETLYICIYTNQTGSMEESRTNEAPLGVIFMILDLKKYFTDSETPQGPWSWGLRK